MQITEQTDQRDWPENVPRTAEDLERRWGSQIDKWVSHYNKVQVNTEDLRQEVRSKVVYKPGFCAKYVARLQKDPEPIETLTLAQVIAFLGITKAAWKRRVAEYNAGEVAWMPKPTNGVPMTSDKAVFLTSEIVDLVDEFEDMGLERELPPPKSTDANFSGYLKMAIHNAVCNFIRTKKRREKERPFECHFEFRNRAARMDEPVPYEEMLVDHHGSDPDVKADLTIALRRIVAAVPSPHGDDIIRHLHNGFTLKEAVRRLNVTNNEREDIQTSLSATLNISLG